MKSLKLMLLAALLLAFGLTGTSFASAVDFNSWNVVGSGYTWTVSDGAWAGSNVMTSSVPLSPQGLFLNGSAAINYNLTGKMKVTTGIDDDMIGLVFG